MTKKGVNLGTTPFTEAIEYFRAKVNLPTETWKDLQGQMHAKAFVVAGAMRDDILSDFRVAVDKAISEGRTLQQFKKDFDAIVTKTGWQYKGTRNWRSEVIYSTNMSVAYAAGRERQMQDPDFRKIFPYARYVCMMKETSRPQHRAWHNTVLPLNDPWWDTHTPPNGFGCECRKEAVSRYDVKQLGLSVNDKAPKDPLVEHIDRTTGEVTTLPAGIDPGWNYNPGDAAFGRPNVPKEERAWKEVPQYGFPSSGKMPRLPVRPMNLPRTQPKLDTDSDIQKAINKELERIAPNKVVTLDLNGSKLAFNVDADILARHLNDVTKRDRYRYLEALVDTMISPDEVRLVFMESSTGKVAIRAKFFKAFVDGRMSSTPVLVVFNVQKGTFVSWTAFKIGMKEIEKRRTGFLVLPKKEAP